MIQGSYVVEISGRVDTLGSVLFEIPDWHSNDFNKPHKSALINT